MHASTVAAQLQSWIGEFAAITQQPIESTAQLSLFLAKRLVEASLAEEDPDVLRIKQDQGWRKVRVSGLRGTFLSYEHADDSRSFGLTDHRNVHPEDRDKFGRILERLERDGIFTGVGQQEARYAPPPAGA